MDFANIIQPRKEMIAEKLKELSSTDRILLLNKFTKLAKPDHSGLEEIQAIEIIQNTLLFKFNKEALIKSFLADDTAVDSPGYRLNDFLVRELTNRSYH